MAGLTRALQEFLNTEGDVFLLTALSTLGAFLYNICSALVGGIQLTLTDD